MLEIQHIEKRYGKQQVLHDINLTLEEGIYALLGPNGAGKSTLMSILCDQLSANAGEVLWCGEPIQTCRDHFVRDLGYAPQQQGLYDEFSGERFLTYMALLKGIPKSQIQDEVLRVSQAVNMQAHIKKKCKTYSGGMKQRILVAQAMLNDPKLMLFDEPSAGLDPKERVSLRHVFQSLAKDHILFIATHVVSDVETIAKEIIFLKKGEIIRQGTLANLLIQEQQENLEDVYLQLFEGNC